jgi:glycine/D-amino acid oxidase-like deaminating enzyme
VTSGQFTTFCARIGAPVQPASDEARRLFDRHLIDDVFEVQEYAFDAARLAARFADRLERAGVEVVLGSHVRQLRPLSDGHIVVSADGAEPVEARHVFNCTYSGLNHVLRDSSLPLIPLRHELTEMALVRVPDALSRVGITVMCGPFFSCMPFPSRDLHTLSHVRYTPHTWWRDDVAPVAGRDAARPAPSSTHFPNMIRDVRRYVPVLGDSEYVESMWETKTVLPSSEVDDSRPILFKRMPHVGHLTNVMGGKIDNIYDVFEELELMRAAGALT